MPAAVLATKLYVPPPRAKIVRRSRLIAQLDESLTSDCRLVLISAPAGFSKTTLLSEWIGERIGETGPKAAWVSLDEKDNDPASFLTYLVAALQTVAPTVGAGIIVALQAAEATLDAGSQGGEPDAGTRDLIGQIAAARATLALTQYQPDAMITQARRALEYLNPDNHLSRIRGIWTVGFAHQVRGDRPAAAQAYAEAIAASNASGNIRFTIVATISLGVIQESNTDLHVAAETFRRGLELAGDHPQPFENKGELGLAHGDADAAATMLAETEQAVQCNKFVHRAVEVAAAAVIVLLRQGDVDRAARLAEAHSLPASRARVRLAQGNPAEAIALLSPLRRQMEEKGWADERLRIMALQVVAHRALGENDAAVRLLGEILALAQPGGFIRLFVDEGEPMRGALSDFRATSRKKLNGHDRPLLDYVDTLLAAFAPPAATAATATTAVTVSRGASGVTDPDVVKGAGAVTAAGVAARSGAATPNADIPEPLSRREIEVLRLFAEGLSNQEIGDRLFLALDTIKGHNRRIFEKLDVKQRTEAVARARRLGLL